MPPGRRQIKPIRLEAAFAAIVTMPALLAG